MTIYMLAFEQSHDDFYGHGWTEFTLDESLGYFTSREDAQVWIDKRAEEVINQAYTSYVYAVTVQNEADKPKTNTKAAKEHAVLVEAGLRKPKKAWKPKVAMDFETWSTTSGRKGGGKERVQDHKSEYSIVEVEAAT